VVLSPLPIPIYTSVSQQGSDAEEMYFYPINRIKTQPREVRKSNQQFMNSSTKDKIKGTAKEAAGKVKEEMGKAIGNRNLRDRGAEEKVTGKVERKVGDVKKVFGK
jgi:uncharacterized protein YjbJ (UPF0337 family)